MEFGTVVKSQKKS